MKKVIGSLIALAIIAGNVSAGWVEGKVDRIRYYNEDNTIINVKRDSGIIEQIPMSPSLSADGKKMLMAMLLTAYTSQTTVMAFRSSTGLSSLKMKQQ